MSGHAKPPRSNQASRACAGPRAPEGLRDQKASFQAHRFPPRDSGGRVRHVQQSMMGKRSWEQEQAKASLGSALNQDKQVTDLDPNDNQLWLSGARSLLGNVVRRGGVACARDRKWRLQASPFWRESRAWRLVVPDNRRCPARVVGGFLSRVASSCIFTRRSF